MPSAPPIRLELRRSRWQAGAVFVAASAAAMALLFASWPILHRSIALALFLGAALAVACHARSRPTLDAVEWRSDGSWRLRGSGRERAVQLAAARIVGPLVSLDLRSADRSLASRADRVVLNLWPDSADGNQLRRLRIRLSRRADDDETAPSAGVVH